MARHTQAYSALRASLKEIEALRKLALQKERKDPIKLRNDINALCRGAIVLLCSHLEAFVKSLGEVALDSLHKKKVPRKTLALSFYYHISKDIVDEIKDTADGASIAEKIFNFLRDDGPFWSQDGHFPTTLPAARFNKGFSNPAYKKIRSYFGRFGYADYNKDLAKKLTAKFHITINMVDHLVDIRNKIAHGDPATTKTPAEILSMIAIVQEYCVATDDVFASWWRTNYCAIR